MKNRRIKKPAGHEWSQRAHTLFDRAASEPPAPSLNNDEIQHLAREEWVKWAQVIAERSEESLDLDTPAFEKPSRGEWARWAQVVIERLTTITQIYSRPPYAGFMPEEERQAKNSRTLDLLRRIHALTDETETPTDSLVDLEHHDERTIAGLKVLLGEVLDKLPELSADMQLLLKSPWFDNCNGRLAGELFRGPMGHEPEGIGSGQAVHGRLPKSIQELLDGEEKGQGRRPREALSGPRAHAPRWHEEAHRRWSDGNSHLLRTAGRME